MKNKNTHCSKGHEYTVENRYILKSGYSECRICRNKNSKKYYQYTPALRKKLYEAHRDNPYYVEYGKQYNKLGKSYIATKKWNEKNKEKRKAHILVNTAVAKGEIIKTSCEKCGNVKVDGHHKDYSKPLEVIWLCRVHHKEEHRLEKLLNR